MISFLVDYIRLFPLVFFGIALMYSWFIFWRGDVISRERKYAIIIVISIAFVVFYSAFESFLQYYVWSNDSFSRLLLPPHQSISYFLFYSWGHFWFGPVLGLSSSLLWYGFLLFLRYIRPESISTTEARAGLLGALISGWPGFVIFVPVSLILAILFAIFRKFTVGDSRVYTTVIFMLSATGIFLWSFFGDPVLFLHLGALRV